MATKKIYVSPSSQTENKYIVGNTNEAVQCRKIAVALVKALERCGFGAMTNITGNMYDRTAESNRWGADLHLPIHTNAFNKKVQGTRIYCYDTKGEGYKASKAIMAALKPITPGTSDSINARDNLYEINKANAPVAYIEVAFHDNEEEAAWIIANTEAIAEAICKGVCNYYGEQYVPAVEEPEPAPEQPTESSPAEKLYRVFNAAGKQVGAYSVEANAFNEVKRQLRSGGEAKITLS